MADALRRRRRSHACAVPRSDAARLPGGSRARPAETRRRCCSRARRCRTANWNSRATPLRPPWRSIGVRPGDRIALLLPNCPQFMVAQFGIWKAGGIVVALNPIYSERELEAALTSFGASIVIALTPFYQRVKNVQARTPVQRVIATSIKEYLPALLRILFTLFKEKKDGHRITLASGDLWFQASAAGPPIIAAAGGHRPARRPRRDPVERRHDRHARRAWLACIGTTWPPAVSCMPGLNSALSPGRDVIMLPLPMFHVYANVGVQPLALAGARASVARPEPARPWRPAEDDSAGEADVLQRHPDAVHRDPQPPDGAIGKSRSQLDQAVFFRRRRIDGRDQAAVRGGDRRAHRRGLFADRRHDGLLRQPGEGHQQDRIDRPSASRRRSPHRRRRTRHARDGRRAKSAS